MQLLVVTRQELLDCPQARSARTVLLEGSWPKGGMSLDDAIDARFDWIDEAAVYWADCLDELDGGATAPHPGARSEGEGVWDRLIRAAWLNALSLRYYLVKLFRVVAYFTEVRPLGSDDHVELVAEWGRDKDYADLIIQLCQQTGAALHVKWVDRPPLPAPTFPANARWRRTLGRVSRCLEPQAKADASARVVLCGNARLLDPVGEALGRRSSQLWWLFDRFALGSWLRWRARGAGQLVCDSSEGRENRLAVPAIERVECRGVDLAEPLRRWFTARLAAYGTRQTRLVEQIDEHFGRVRPQLLVLDEDATPMARAAVAVARRYGATSVVVQHGAPCCRFGFAPLAADRIVVWGQSSADQLTRWAVPRDRITIAGSPQHDRLYQTLSGQRSERRRTLRQSPRILLLATVLPRDDRPDAVDVHLTRQTYAEMLRTAVAAVAGIPGAQLTVKLHPRAPRDPVVDKLLADHPSLHARVVQKGSIERCLDNVDCVLSCISSAGIDATLSGRPVIQLLPAGSGDILPSDQWGLAGSARNQHELQRLLDKALARGNSAPLAPSSHVFSYLSGSADRIAEAILQAAAPIPEEMELPAPHADHLACSTQD